MGWGPMADWNWDDHAATCGSSSLPFVLAVVWWIWSDASGWTKRKAMIRDAERKQRSPRPQHRRDGPGPPAQAPRRQDAAQAVTRAAPPMPLKIVARETLRVGQPLVVDADSPVGRYATVFEDDGETGCFYAVDTDVEDGNPVQDALLVYVAADVTDADAARRRWRSAGPTTASRRLLLINDQPHAAFDFDLPDVSAGALPLDSRWRRPRSE